MRRKAGLLGGLILLAVLLASSGVMAALGPHSIPSGTDSKALQGECAVCHNVSATAAIRGWSSTPYDCTTGWFTQEITKLCWSCHSSTGTVGANDVVATAMSTSNHKFTKASTPAQPKDPSTRQDQAVTDSNLPYTAGTALQCTSCHNVHNNQYAPFMMKSSIRSLCDTCHPGRNYNTIRSNNTAGTDNCSVHPLGSAVQMDNTSVGGVTDVPVSIKTVANMDSALKVAKRDGNGKWVLGGHMDNAAPGNPTQTDTISCETCHPVHGTASLVGVNDLLAINNYSAAGDNSALCEGCHYGGAAGQNVGILNRGDHPIDQNPGRFGFYPSAVSIPNDWLQAGGRLDRGASAFWDNGTKDIPRCASCHDAHGGLNAKSLFYAPIPTAANGEWCFSCHGAAGVVPPLHHSTTQTFSQSSVSCSGCHGGTGAQAEWSAHNGFTDFAVQPEGNDGAADPAANFNNSSANSNTFERLCESCHTAVNPTFFKAVSGRFDNTNVILPNSHGVVTGTLTHLSSDFGGNVPIIDADRTHNTYFRKGTDTWGTVASGMGAYTGVAISSKYANWGAGNTPQDPGNGAYMICESCHNLLTNAGTVDDGTGGYAVNLLLHQYADDGQGSGYTVTATGTDPKAAARTSETSIGDGFCRGCHSQNVIAAANLDAPLSSDNTYVHYPAAHTVSTARFTYGAGLTPYGRPTNTIMTTTGTCPDNTTADMGGAPGVMSYPADDTLNCDSCHRPHNADPQATNGMAWSNANANSVRKWILEDGSVATDNLAKTQACAQCHSTEIMCGY